MTPREVALAGALRRVVEMAGEALQEGAVMHPTAVLDAIGTDIQVDLLHSKRWLGVQRPALTPEMIEKALSGESLGPALDSLMRSEDYQRAYRWMIEASDHKALVPIDVTPEQQEAIDWMSHPLHQRAVHAQVVEMGKLRGLYRRDLKVLVPRWWPESIDGGKVQGMPVQRSHLVNHLSVVPR
jgi:hypothetical protein